MYEFDRSTPVAVALRAHSGEVDIVAEERPSVQVEIVPYTNDEKGREAADSIRVALDGDTLTIQTPGIEYWSWRRTPKLRIHVRVPAGSSLTAKTASAPIQASGLYSAVQVEAASGRIHLDDVTGDASIDSASGEVSVGTVGGSLRMRTASGRIAIGDVTGDVNAGTASGSITVRSAGGSLRAKTASGSVDIGSLRQGAAEIGTASGSVRVGVAPGTGVYMDLTTASGHSTSDLTSQGDQPPAGEQAALDLRVRTASGNIHVFRAAEAGRSAA